MAKLQISYKMGYVLNSVITSGYLVPFLPKKGKETITPNYRKASCRGREEAQAEKFQWNQATQQRAHVDTHGKTKIPLAEAVMSKKRHVQ